jgi:hypothetical protein
MKKLLLVLAVVAMASFLFVGCLSGTTTPTTPTEPTTPEICPTVAVTSQVAVAGKNYIKAGSQTITVTFAVPTEPVSVYVGAALKDYPVGVPSGATEVVIYPNADKTVYTGKTAFAGCCDVDYIYVLTCDTCAPCKYPYTVDGVGPASEIKIASAACVCEGVTLKFDTPTQTTTCGVTGVCCGDTCSGFASYTIDLYASDPFDACCDIPCITPAYSCPAGVACPIDCDLTCIVGGTTIYGDKTYWVVASLLDKVGNKTRYYAKVVLDTDSIVSVTEFAANLQSGLCTDFINDDTDVTATSTAGVVSGTIGGCK